MRSRREVRADRIMRGWPGPMGLWAAVAMRFRGPGTHLMAALRTCCVDLVGEFHAEGRLSRAECHAAWDALAEYALDACDCPHRESTGPGCRGPYDRPLAAQRRAFLGSTRDRLPIPAGWEVTEMDQLEEED